MNFDDFYSGAALGSGASGAVAGGTVGGWPGALIGGAAGLFGGAYANSKRDEATKLQQQNLDAMAAEMRARSLARRKEFLANLDKALSFYGPAQSEWDRLYAQPGRATPATGQGAWANTGVK